jgi:hypothetical protein
MELGLSLPGSKLMDRAVVCTRIATLLAKQLLVCRGLRTLEEIE